MLIRADFEMAGLNGTSKNDAHQGENGRHPKEMDPSVFFSTNYQNGHGANNSSNWKEKCVKRRAFNEQECWELATESVMRLSKGFFSGVGLYAGVRIVTALLKNPFRKRYV